MTNEELDDLRGWSVELQKPFESSGSNRMGALLSKLLAEVPAPASRASRPVLNATMKGGHSDENGVIDTIVCCPHCHGKVGVKSVTLVRSRGDGS